MVDDELGDARTLPGGEDRDEPVHLAVEPDAFEDLAAVGLEGAAEVVERDAREPGDQAVGDPRGDLAGQPAVLAIAPPARDDVEAQVEPFEEAGDVGRDRSDGRRRSAPAPRPAPGRARPRARRSGRSCACREAIADVLRVGILDLHEPGCRSVGRAVVDEDQLVAQRRGRRARRSARRAGGRRSPARCRPGSAPRARAGRSAGIGPRFDPREFSRSGTGGGNGG